MDANASAARPSGRRGSRGEQGHGGRNRRSNGMGRGSLYEAEHRQRPLSVCREARFHVP
jgi:hypothetical protein